MSKDQVNAPAYPLLCPATKDQSREKQSTENCGLNGPSFLLYATCVACIHNASAQRERSGTAAGSGAEGLRMHPGRTIPRPLQADRYPLNIRLG